MGKQPCSVAYSDTHKSTLILKNKAQKHVKKKKEKLFELIPPFWPERLDH